MRFDYCLLDAPAGIGPGFLLALSAAEDTPRPIMTKLPITKKVINSRDVIFEEDKTWEWKEDQEEIKWINTDLILEDEAGVPTVLAEDPRVPEEEPQSPVHSFPVFNRRNSPTVGKSSISPKASSSKEPRRMRKLEDLYDATQVIEDTTLFCFSQGYPQSRKNSMKQQKWMEPPKGNSLEELPFHCCCQRLY